MKWLRGRRQSMGLLAVCALLAGSLAVMTTGASAYPGLAASGFEAGDANLAPNGATPNFDWNSFSTGTVTNWSTGTAPYRRTTGTVNGWQFAGFEDAQAATTDTGFAGGVKQDNDCGALNGSKAPNKDDMKRVYLSSKTVDVNGDDHVILNLAWVRIPQNNTAASAHIGFEFNQATSTPTVNCATTLTGMGAPLAKRVGGDMLVVYDFEGGSNAPHIKLSRWLKTGEFTDAPATCEVNNSTVAAGCWGNTVDLTTAGFAEAAVNFVDARNPPLTSDTVKPANTTNPGNAEFGEAGLDLTQAGVFGEGSCETFGRAYAVSRSSGTSSQAAMEDIVGPGAFLLTNCASVNVTKTGSDGGSQSGAVFTLYSGTTTSGTVVGTCTVDSTGQCGTSPSFVDLQPGSYTIDETSVPTGYDKDASLPFTFSVVAGEAKSLAFTNVAAPGHIDIAKTDDADAPLDGATFTLYDGSSTTATVLGTCTTGVSNYNSSTTPTAGSGTCSFIDVPPGTYTVDETGVPTGYAKASGLPETFTLGNGGTKTISASNPRTFKVIELVCRQADATLYPSSATIGGQSSGTTLSRSDLDSVLSGLTSADRDAVQAALCGLSTSQGARGGFQTGTTTATVGIS